MAWVAAWTLAGTYGCSQSQPPPISTAPVQTPPAKVEAEVAPDRPSYAELASAQNRRAADLVRLYAEGVMTIRWRDDRGRHEEQGNVELWTVPVNRVAARIYKAAIGEEFLWLGGDGRRCWLFDLRDRQDSTAYVARQDIEGAFGPDAPLDLGPLTLLDLLGVTPLPELPAGGGAGPSIGYDEHRDAWTIVAPGRGGFLRLFIDRVARLPSRVECLSAAGEVLLRSDLEVGEYESVEVDEKPPGAYPKLPRRALLTSARDADHSVRLHIGDASARASSEVFKNKVFDFDVLMKRFKPARVEDSDAAADQRRTGAAGG